VQNANVQVNANWKLSKLIYFAIIQRISHSKCAPSTAAAALASVAMENISFLSA
jgi:hypothetical protein